MHSSNAFAPNLQTFDGYTEYTINDAFINSGNLMEIYEVLYIYNALQGTNNIGFEENIIYGIVV